MSDRITSHYKSGSGDSGYSLLLDGHRIRKNDPACWIYAEVEKTINTVSSFLLNYDVQYLHLLETLQFLQANLFSLSSFCFCKGKTDKFIIDPTFIEDLDTQIKEIKFVVGNASDFIWYNNKKAVALDSIRILIRDTERAFTAWRYHATIMEFIVDLAGETPDLAHRVAKAIKLYASLLNRLSNYLWWATRYENLKSEKVENYWEGNLNGIKPRYRKKVDDKTIKYIKNELVTNFPKLVITDDASATTCKIDDHTTIMLHKDNEVEIVTTKLDAALAWFNHFNVPI